MESVLPPAIPGMTSVGIEKNVHGPLFSLDDIFDESIPSTPKSTEIVPPPPIFSHPNGFANDGQRKLINLDEIFDEFYFDPSNRSNALPVSSSGHTTSISVDKKTPQNIENNYKYNEGDEDSDDDADDDMDEEGRNRKKSRGLPSNMTEEQKVERR